jgi:RNA polymerase sigma-70 factor, ECF subfamily
MLNDEDLDEGSRRSSAVVRLDSLALLDALPTDQRAAVRGRVIDRRDYAELARELDCTELVVRQRVSRGLRMLRTLAGYTR